jgi:uncharacterized protein YacL
LLLLDLLRLAAGLGLLLSLMMASMLTSFLVLIHDFGMCILALLESMLTVLAMQIASSDSDTIQPRL